MTLRRTLLVQANAMERIYAPATNVTIDISCASPHITGIPEDIFLLIIRGLTVWDILSLKQVGHFHAPLLRDSLSAAAVIDVPQAPRNMLAFVSLVPLLQVFTSRIKMARPRRCLCG